MNNTLEQRLGAGRVQTDKDIAPYLTLRTKTIAQYYFEAETKEDIVNAVKAAHDLDLPVFILGGGSNLAITKAKIAGIVIRNMYRKMEVTAETDEYVDVLISSGYPMARLVVETAAKGWEGFEHHLGLPGTLGGGVAMNSKWYVDRKSVHVGDPLLKATLVTKEGQVKEVDKSYFQFAYDYSILKDTHEIFIEGIFRLEKNDPAILKQRSKDASDHRHKTQVVGKPTCGCMFQNIPEEVMKKHSLHTTSAGYLIDQAGLKNYKVGNFIVSDQHANFFINTGEGNPDDLLQLIQTVKQKVKEKFGIELVEEVIIV